MNNQKGALVGTLATVASVFVFLQHCSVAVRDAAWAKKAEVIARDVGEAHAVAIATGEAPKVADGLRDESSVSKGISHSGFRKEVNAGGDTRWDGFVTQSRAADDFLKISHHPAAKLIQNPPTFTEVMRNLDGTSFVSEEKMARVFWNLAAQKDPARRVNRVVPFLIKPANGVSYKNIFGHQPTGLQMHLALGATTRLREERILGEVTDNLSALDVAIEKQTREGDLVVVIGHNVGGTPDSPVITLASGDKVSAAQLREIGDQKKRQIVIVCCFAEESGITGEISYAEAAAMTVNMNQVIQKSAYGIHIGLVYQTLPQIYSSIVAGKNIKHGVIVIAVTGGTGWLGYEFMATLSGQQARPITTNS